MDSGIRSFAARWPSKGKFLPLAVYFYTFLTSNPTNTIDLLVIHRPVYVYTGLFVSHSILGGHHE
jgi:hypothetical protein